MISLPNMPTWAMVVGFPVALGCLIWFLAEAWQTGRHIIRFVHDILVALPPWVDRVFYWAFFTAGSAFSFYYFAGVIYYRWMAK